MAFQRWKNVVYDVINLLVKSVKRTTRQKTLLLIRTNNIGDYTLWRNILPAIRNSQKFRDYHITLIGNQAWKNLFEYFDASLIDDAIWVDLPRHKKNLRYRYHLLKSVREKGFETVINTLSSRCMRMDDS